jgi:hypothetical protein
LKSLPVQAGKVDTPALSFNHLGIILCYWANNGLTAIILRRHAQRRPVNDDNPAGFSLSTGPDRPCHFPADCLVVALHRANLEPLQMPAEKLEKVNYFMTAY